VSGGPHFRRFPRYSVNTPTQTSPHIRSNGSAERELGKTQSKKLLGDINMSVSNLVVFSLERRNRNFNKGTSLMYYETRLSVISFLFLSPLERHSTVRKRMQGHTSIFLYYLLISCSNNWPSDYQRQIVGFFCVLPLYTLTLKTKRKNSLLIKFRRHSKSPN